MTKLELIREVSERTGINRTEAMIVLESAVQTIKDTLADGESIFVRGWGTWSVKHRAAKSARNICKNEMITIKERDVPHFKPCKEFLEMVSE